MKPGLATLAVTLMLATSAFAATPKPMSLDKSSSFLIDPATAEAVWKENTPARVTKLYPMRKYRFVSEVTGGFTENKTCVVSARAMLLPVVLHPVQGTKVVYAPIKSASAFDAQPSLDEAQCRDLAKGKLKEAIHSIMSTLVAEAS